MITTVTTLAAALQVLLTSSARDLGRVLGAFQRHRRLDGASWTQTLVFGWLDDPDASLDRLADFAADRGLEVSPQALDQRFSDAAVVLVRQLLHEALTYTVQAAGPVLPVLQRFQGVYVFDASTLVLPPGLAELFPGCGGDAGAAACKLHVCLEVSGRGVVELGFSNGRTNELSVPLGHAPLPAGALRLADTGYFCLDTLSEYSVAG